uniref:Uncharacterized protein n=1 Tax=viral metagenome TaxID=1070528 RepID=A0A6C0LKS1_9ZZZZ
MDDRQRLQLQNMIKSNNTTDFTESIRELKHSQHIRNDVDNLILLKAKYRDSPEELHNAAAQECYFLFTFYTDIYNKLRKDEISISILFKLIDALKSIEDGQYDQHEASFRVGTILKELYIDSALKKAEKLNKDDDKKEVETKEPVNINWKQFKATKIV